MTNDQYNIANKIKLEIAVLNRLISRNVLEEHINAFPEFRRSIGFDILEKDIANFIFRKVQDRTAELEDKLQEI